VLFVITGVVVSFLIGEPRHKLILCAENEEQSRHLKAIVDWSDDAIVSKDLNGVIKTWNRAAERMFGYSAKEAIGQNISLLIPSTVNNEMPSILSRIRNGEIVDHYEIVRKHKDGEDIAVSLTVSPIRDITGRIVGASKIARNISGQKTAEEALKVAYAELAAIHASAPVLLLSVDEEVRVERANDLAARLSGQQPADTLGLGYGDAIGCLNALANPKGCGNGPACGHCAVRRTVSDTLHNSREHHGIEAWLPLSINGEKEERCLLISTAPVESGGRKKALLCAQDITDSKRQGALVAQQNPKLRQQAELINLSHDAIITSAPDGTVTGWNAGATEIYGWTEEEAVGKLNRSVLATGSSFTPETNDGAHRQSQWEGEFIHTRRDGKNLVIDSRHIVLRDEAGAHVETMEIDRNITERKVAERDLKHSLNEKTVLLHEIHHRVKNNLQVICSLMSMQANSVDEPETVAKLKDCGRRVMSMAMIHQQLYSQADMSSIDLADYGRELANQLFDSYSRSDSITCRLDLASTRVTIEQAVPCGLILNELITNALKYAYPNGRGEVLIHLSSEGDLAHMTVSDQGIGMPMGFDPETSKSLGMTLVHALTGQLNGQFEVGNRPGASFTVRFKKEAVHPAAAASAASSH
jgi:PAS domain S-box-containing protein